jgi:hypothetical protein
MASIGLSRTVIENLHLKWSAIGRENCIIPGERNPHHIDVDLNYGVDYRYGYTREACSITSKQEMLARELVSILSYTLSRKLLQKARPFYKPKYCFNVT